MFYAILRSGVRSPYAPPISTINPLKFQRFDGFFVALCSMLFYGILCRFLLDFCSKSVKKVLNFLKPPDNKEEAGHPPRFFFYLISSYFAIKNRRGLSHLLILFVQIFQVINSMICHLDPLAFQLCLFFQSIHPVNQVIVLIHLLFQLPDPVVGQPGGCDHTDCRSQQTAAGCDHCHGSHPRFFRRREGSENKFPCRLC